jgi:hypothetical protein
MSRASCHPRRVVPLLAPGALVREGSNLWSDAAFPSSTERRCSSRGSDRRSDAASSAERAHRVDLPAADFRSRTTPARDSDPAAVVTLDISLSNPRPSQPCLPPEAHNVGLLKVRRKEAPAMAGAESVMVEEVSGRRCSMRCRSPRTGQRSDVPSVADTAPAVRTSARRPISTACWAP